MNKETLSSAFTRYQEQKVMLTRTHNSPKRWSEVALAESYIPERVDGMLAPRGKLWELVERIGKFRMEGKNRRDSATGKPFY